jgi:general secretion pathway protein B
MSFILDALKKSEVERQRQTVPGLIDVPPATRRRRLPWWAVSLGVLLIVNVLVVSYLLIRSGPRPAAQPQAATSASSRIAPAPVAPTEVAPTAESPPRPRRRAAPGMWIRC